MAGNAFSQVGGAIKTQEIAGQVAAGSAIRGVTYLCPALTSLRKCQMPGCPGSVLRPGRWGSRTQPGGSQDQREVRLFTAPFICNDAPGCGRGAWLRLLPAESKDLLPSFHLKNKNPPIPSPASFFCRLEIYVESSIVLHRLSYLSCLSALVTTVLDVQLRYILHTCSR